MLLLDIFCCLEVIIRMQAAGLFIFQWQPRDCISADRSQEAGLGLRPRLRQDVLPSVPQFPHVEKGKVGLDWMNSLVLSTLAML